MRYGHTKSSSRKKSELLIVFAKNEKGGLVWPPFFVANLIVG